MKSNQHDEILRGFSEAIRAACAGPLAHISVRPHESLAALLAVAQDFGDRVGADVGLGLAIALVARMGPYQAVTMVANIAQKVGAEPRKRPS